MKQRFLPLLAALGAALVPPAVAADGHAGHAGMTAARPAATPLSDGLVKKVDKAAGRLTLSHGPLPNGMPAMTMAFRVRDAAWLDQVKPGDAVRFAAEQVDGAMTVVRLERN